MKPTGIIDRLWVYAESPIVNNDDIYGSWVINLSSGEVNGWWDVIKKRTEEGSLGYTAKCSTKRNISPKYKISEYEVHVYTEQQNIGEIREKIRDLGVTWRIPYRTHEATTFNTRTRYGNIVSECWI